MAVTAVNYTRKDPQIQAIPITDLAEFRDWVPTNLPSNYVVNDAIIQYGTLLMTDGVNSWSIQVGAFMCIDSNGKMFKLDKETLDAFYDEV